MRIEKILHLLPRLLPFAFAFLSLVHIEKSNGHGRCQNGYKKSTFYNSHITIHYNFFPMPIQRFIRMSERNETAPNR